MTRCGWFAGVLTLALLVPTALPAQGAAEFRADRDFLSSVLEKLPPTPFEAAGRYRGRVDAFHLVGIDPKARRVVVACRVAGEFDESAVVAGLSKPANPAATTLPRPGPPRAWKAYRFDVHVAVNVEPGPDGAPRFRFDVDEVRRRQLDGLAGGLAKVMGGAFDRIVTSFADKKAEGLNDRLNAEVVKKIGMFKDYGLLTGVDYAPGGIVLVFDQTRLRSEGVVCHVFPTPAPGTVPLYRWVDLRSGAHVYTTDAATPDPRLVKFEGIACHVLAAPAAGSVPFYRWRGRSECLFTTTLDREPLRRAGYRLESVACHVYTEPKPGTVPLHRFLDPRTGRHFYTVHPQGEFAH